MNSHIKFAALVAIIATPLALAACSGEYAGTSWGGIEIEKHKLENDTVTCFTFQEKGNGSIAVSCDWSAKDTQ